MQFRILRRLSGLCNNNQHKKGEPIKERWWMGSVPVEIYHVILWRQYIMDSFVMIVVNHLPPALSHSSPASAGQMKTTWRTHCGDTSLGCRWEHITICSVLQGQWKGDLHVGSLSAGDRTGGHMPLFYSLLSPSLLSHPSVRGHFNDEHFFQ